MLSKFFRLGWLCALLIAVLGAAEVVDGDAAAEVATTIEQLRTALQSLPRARDQQPETEHVIAVVEAVVLPHVDLELAGRLIMGPYWRKANASQQAKFIDTYRVLLLRLYALHALDYLDAKVEFLSTQTLDDGQRQQVRTRVQRAGRPDVTVDYQLRKRDGKWRVFDAVVNGVSVVITMRRAVSEDMSRYGIDGVIERLQHQLTAGSPPHDP
jgi:phospholipid transport system substrate-binding protein